MPFFSSSPRDLSSCVLLTSLSSGLGISTGSVLLSCVIPWGVWGLPSPYVCTFSPLFPHSLGPFSIRCAVTGTSRATLFRAVLSIPSDDRLPIGCFVIPSFILIVSARCHLNLRDGFFATPAILMDSSGWNPVLKFSIIHQRHSHLLGMIFDVVVLFVRVDAYRLILSETLCAHYHFSRYIRSYLFGHCTLLSRVIRFDKLFALATRSCSPLARISGSTSTCDDFVGLLMFPSGGRFFASLF